MPELAQPRRKIVKPKISISTVRKAVAGELTSKKIKERDLSPAAASVAAEEIN